MKNQETVVASDDVPSHVRHHLTSQPQSGLSIPQYCNQNSISSWSFYQWRKRYQSKLTDTSAVVGSRFSFSELGVLEHAGNICDIRFPTGITISVNRGVSREELSGILAVVTGRQSC